ncbi:MAG TPA: TIGR03435 family protein [Terracidiphilus sp.]|nr:TIGR03435 family protein [Terracidiphilus sp.]
MRCGFGLFVGSVLLATSAVALCQAPQTGLSFSVIAIHRSKPESRGGFIKPMPNGTGYLVQNFTVKGMMSVVYRIPSRQISGGPDWFDRENFDVEAKADDTHNIDELHTMFKNMLADRFGLKFHIEMKPGAVYELIVDKAGVKMKADPAGGGVNIPIMPDGQGRFVGTRVPMEYLCWYLGQQMRSDARPVIDKTGLVGVYDFTLSFMPDLPPELQKLPALQDAVEEQLGLKLVPAKGPVPNYVIDRVDQPSAN